MDRAQQERDEAPVASTLYDNPNHRSDRSALWIAGAIAVAVHVAVLIANLPDRDRPIVAAEDPGPVLEIIRYDIPPPPPPPEPAPRPQPRSERRLPLPDPEPDIVAEPVAEPEPIVDPSEFTSEIEIVIDDPPPVSAQPPAPVGPIPGHTPGLVNPVVIASTKVQPRYPEAARLGRLEGRVILQATIDRDGVVQQIEVLQVSRPGLGFEQRAVEAVREWRYTPGTIEGKPVPVLLTVIVDFSLR